MLGRSLSHGAPPHADDAENDIEDSKRHAHEAERHGHADHELLVMHAGPDLAAPRVGRDDLEAVLALCLETAKSDSVPVPHDDRGLGVSDRVARRRFKKFSSNWGASQNTDRFASGLVIFTTHLPGRPDRRSHTKPSPMWSSRLAKIFMCRPCRPSARTGRWAPKAAVGSSPKSDLLPMVVEDVVEGCAFKVQALGVLKLSQHEVPSLSSLREVEEKPHKNVSGPIHHKPVAEIECA
jgi:hypothetical protein